MCVCLFDFATMTSTLSSLINYKQELELKPIDRGDTDFTLQPHSTTLLVSKKMEWYIILAFEFDVSVQKFNFPYTLPITTYYVFICLFL